MTQARDTGELVNDVGTAGYTDVTTSSTDTTAGRVTKVGDFGLGAQLTTMVTSDLDAIAQTQFNRFTSSATGKPSFDFGTVVTYVHTSSVATQVAFDTASSLIETRYKTGASTWSAWQPVYTGANYQPEDFTGLGVRTTLFNNSGAALANNDTVSGANLRVGKFIGGAFTLIAVAYLGTWQNVSGATINNGEGGQFVRIA